MVKETEDIGEQMNPYYEEIRQAIDQETYHELSIERLTEVKRMFEQGTEQYQQMLKKITQLRAPAHVLGIHKKLERSYKEYVAGCREMVDAIQPETGVDVHLFDASEKKQDQATDNISFAITRMSNLLLKK